MGSVLHVSTWDDVLWQVQVFSQELDTLFSQGVVVVLPRELGLDVTLGSQRLQSLDNVQVLGVNLLVLRLVEVLLGDNNTFLEQVSVDLGSFFLWNQHDCGVGLRFSWGPCNCNLPTSNGIKDTMYLELASEISPIAIQSA